MILTTAQMRALEEAAFARGLSAVTLMDAAGEGCARALREFFPRPGLCLAVFGKGHNGGDALVTARHLAVAGWKTHLIPQAPRAEWAPLTERKFGQAGLAHQHAPGLDGLAEAWQSAAGFRGPILLLDGLLGIGAHGPLRQSIAEFTSRLNALRAGSAAQVVAIDLPSGLDADSGAADPLAVVADFTLTVACAKTGLLADRAAHHVGRLVEIPVAALDPGEGADSVATPRRLAATLPRRDFEAHKGLFGRIAIVAGSSGFAGAGVMSATACVHAGAGLVSLYVPHALYPVAAAACPPEVMVHGVAHYREVLETKHDVLALGPGLGLERDEEVLELIRQSDVPTIIDADALNVLSAHLAVLAEGQAPRLLTPHPGEMARLDPGAKERTRAETVHTFVEKHRVTLLLKGARTIVGERGRPLSYNSTGNPGMATGGMGDLLTGVCAALAGQGLKLYDSARVGAWLCGRAAELAVNEREESFESLAPMHLPARFGRAFQALREGGF